MEPRGELQFCRDFVARSSATSAANGRGGGCAHEASLRAASIFADASTFAKATEDRVEDDTVDKTFPPRGRLTQL